MRGHKQNTGAAMETFNSVVVPLHPQAQRAWSTALQLRALLAFATRCLDLLLTWQRRATERATLAAMNERELRDIGLARNEVLVEADKPFWRA
jgi:uncharacterized protein YjiS (DUF1127 family)